MKKTLPLLLALASFSCATQPEAPRTAPPTEPPSVTLTLGDTTQAKAIHPLFSGISMETETVRPAADGTHYFSADNTRLIALFKQLGVKHLRIGGNTVDDKTKTPGLADIDALFAFAKRAGVKVTYSVRLKDGNPAESAVIAKHIYDHYPDLIHGITIGNECDQYIGWAGYLAAAKAHAKAMRAVAPALALNGPDIHLEHHWLLNYAKAFKNVEKIEYIGAHAYFGGNAYGNKKPVQERDPAPLRAEMLSPAWHAKYNGFYKSFGPELAKQGLPYRLDETNTYYIGGAPGASNSMAAAVWATDYLYWWAQHGAQGINFHTGTTLPFVKGALPHDALRKPCYYAVLWALPQDAYATQAVGYGLKAFDLGSHGKLFPIQVTAADKANVVAHAVLADDGSVFVTILNKEIGGKSRVIAVSQPKDARFNRAESIALGVKNHDAGATEGFTLGGAGIGTDGSWNGQWDKVATEGDTLAVTVPPTSAVILHLSK